MGRAEMAIAAYTAVIQYDPNFAAAYFCRGDACDGKGDLVRASDDYSAALEANPKS